MSESFTCVYVFFVVLFVLVIDPTLKRGLKLSQVRQCFPEEKLCIDSYQNCSWSLFQNVKEN